MKTADTILNRMERVTYKNWCDAECEQATISKIKAYERMQKRNHTRKAVEEYRIARKDKKRVHKQKEKKKTFMNMNLRNWNVSEVTMKANPSIKN
jgi:IS5 family transposase